MYYRGADAAILVYDITSPVSFDSLHHWVSKLRSFGPKSLMLAICGNKSDLEDRRQISYERAKSYSEEIGAVYFETSARNNVNVELVFNELGKFILPTIQEYISNQLPGEGGGIDLTSLVSKERESCLC